MTNEEIIIAACKKAYKNGCHIPQVNAIATADGIMSSMLEAEVIYPIIYNECFAWAFWKDEKPMTVKVTYSNGNSAETKLEGWQYWLSQTPLSDDIYEYLARFLVSGE